jgi:hypothetical protein
MNSGKLLVLAEKELHVVCQLCPFGQGPSVSKFQTSLEHLQGVFNMGGGGLCILS